MDKWRKLFNQEIKDYTAQYRKTKDLFGFFSVPRFDVATKIGLIIRDYCKGEKCLDIGCGALKRPVYMAKDMDFTGIDPDHGFQQRDFPFKTAMGEDIPYPDQSFGCVTIMSVIDHVYDPDKVLDEAYRVLKPQGYIFVWYRDEEMPKTHGHHLHYFTIAKMEVILTAHKFTVLKQQFYPHNSKAGYPDTMLAIGRKA